MNKKEEMIFRREEIVKVFPFYILLDENLVICDAGPSIRNVLPIKEGDSLFSYFIFKRPFGRINNLADLLTFWNQILILKSAQMQLPPFRGQILSLGNKRGVLLISPWVTSADELMASGFQITDFALHDSITDMLQVMTTQSLFAADLKEALEQLKEQTYKMERSEKSLKNNNEFLSSLILNLNNGILFESPDRKIMISNQAFSEHFGIPMPISKLKGIDCKDAMNNIKEIFLYPSKEIERIEYLISTRRVAKNDMVKMSDGRMLERDFIPIGSNDECLGFLWVYSDVTQFKRVQDALKSEKKKVELSLRSKEIFMANMSHELRNPINIVMGISGLLKSTNLNDLQQEYLNIIRSASESLLSLVNDILEFEKIEARKVSLQSVVYNLKDLLGEIQTSTHYLAEHKNLKFVFICDPLVPQLVTGDPLRLKQILMNLLGNSIKFTERGMISLSVSTKEKNGSIRIIFKITDTGIGIPANQIDLIFKRFIQAESGKTRTEQTGTGLGLTIVKNLVELQNGSIQVESQVNKGSTFTVELPLFIASETSALENVKPTDNSSKIDGKKILIVEDNLTNQMILERQLTGMGFSSSSASNGKIALEKIEKDQFHLALMDLQMPEMDGYETTKMIRLHTDPEIASIPILALSANVIQGEAERCEEAGMDGYISKPVSPEELHKQILKLLNFDNKTKQLDLTYLKEVSINDTNWINQVLSDFLKQSDSFIATITQSVKIGDSVALSSQMHKVRSSLKSLGASELAALSKNIETHLLDNSSIENSLQDINELVKGTRNLEREIKIHLKRKL